MNGAGVATGVGTTGGRQGYVFGRLGAAFDVTPDDEVALLGEFGRQAFRTGAYVEPLSIANPFEAQIATATDVMNVAKARAQLTHAFSAHIDATLWGALAQAYDYRSTITASIPAMGSFAPVRQLANWSEYGLRLSYHVGDLVTIDAFANGVTGDRASQTLFDANTGLSVAGLTTRIHIGGGARIRF